MSKLTEPLDRLERIDPTGTESRRFLAGARLASALAPFVHRVGAEPRHPTPAQVAELADAKAEMENTA